MVQFGDAELIEKVKRARMRDRHDVEQLIYEHGVEFVELICKEYKDRRAYVAPKSDTGPGKE